MKFGYLDILRGTSIFAVVLLHTAAPAVQNQDYTTAGWVAASLIEGSLRWCVPVFVMVSGALLLDRSKNEPQAAFFRRRLQKIIIPLFFWLLVYYGPRIMRGDIARTSEVLLHGGGHLWYLFMISGLYLFTPALRIYVNAASGKNQLFVIIVIFILASTYYTVSTLCNYPLSTIITLFLPFLGYYLCGNYLHSRRPINIGAWPLIGLIFFCTVFIILFTDCLVSRLGTERGLVLHHYLGIPVIFISISIFILISKCQQIRSSSREKIFSVFKFAAPKTLGIYLVHPLVIYFFQKAMGFTLADNTSWLITICFSVVVFFFSLIVVSIFLKVPYLRRVV